MQELPLTGIRVVDFTQVRAGAHVTQWLAVMGAEVIKIESILRPDGRRVSLPGKPQPGPNKVHNFATFNYSKKDITLNMKQPRAAELVKELVKVSDIVADNFGGPVMDRWGLGYKDLKKIKPDIIALSVSGWGRTGPYSERLAYAPIIDAFNGFVFTNGYAGEEARPIGNGGRADSVAAQHAVFAIMAALYHRAQTGKGQYIDLSMAEANMAFAAEMVLNYTVNEKEIGRMGNRDEIMAPHGCYRCRGKDKWVAIAVASDEEWSALCDVMGNPEWTNREEFSDALSRWQNQDELDRLITEWTLNYTHLEVMDMLQTAGVMAGATLNIPEIVNDPHLKERGFLVELQHPEMGKIVRTGLPWRLSEIPRGFYRYPPLIGEHNDYVFGELLGLSKDEIKQLQDEQVIY